MSLCALRRVGLVVAAFALVAPALALVACGEETTGHAIHLKTALVTDLPPDRTFTTDFGWTVTLDRALAATGPLYYYDGEPAFTLAPGRLSRVLAALAPIRPAWAHPGHYQAGQARGQMLAPFSVDLLAGRVALPDGVGVTGVVRSGQFSFAAPSAGPAAPALAEHVALLEGRATKAGQTVFFSLTADLTDVERTAKGAAIGGCRFADTDLERDGTVTVTVKPRVWLDLVDFSELPPGSADARSPAGPDSTARIAFALGLAQLSAYEFTYSSP